MQQILINFLNNAVKYTPRGGSISLKAFEESSSGNRANVCFVVSDTGVGIKEEFMPQLFKPFTRGNNGNLNDSISMGLGLSIAYNLIKAMDGKVEVQSKVGEGSTFTIYVKLNKYVPGEANSGSAKKPNSLNGYNLAGRTILIAEDNPLNMTILGAMLSHEGVNFVEAHDGEEAVKAYNEAEDNTFDCVLMDMRMPKIDGIKATMMIRDSGKPDSASIPIIGVSANGFSDDIKQAHKAGINGYVTKPLDRDNLLSTISNLLDIGK